MRDHGGDMDRAIAAYGAGDWLDLSTGINAVPYPLPDMPAHAWGALPTRAEMAALEAQAKQTYKAAGAGCIALAGAQGAIQLVPRLAQAGTARVLGPTYNEHAASLRAQGWEVAEVPDPALLRGADLAVVVNPNNPTGGSHTVPSLIELATQVGLLVVDESFADPTPDLSILPHLEALSAGARVLVLRSFGKFYGLAGARLGFALGPVDLIDQMRALAGPWAVSGPAIACGMAALVDTVWQDQTTARLAQDCARLDDLAAAAEWTYIGGTHLFRSYMTPDAQAVQDHLARHKIWSRIFPWSDGWVRLGLPPVSGWNRLETAFAAMPGAASSEKEHTG
ncbi:MAG: threonine-phosphate decarboxylase CobD [Pelagimonas sp.]|nr:threonine-phosphate decarboxylase CobD [Pelagimonas sp.]